MADQITLTVDGQIITARPDQTVIQAAMEAGIYIPYLCYYPKMKPYGACRMCVVETEVGGRKGVQASCTVPVAQDMVVGTKTPEIVELRRGIMDLLMSEHPHGCLTCHRIELCGPQDICQRHVAVTDRCVTCPKNERCELKDTVRYVELELTTPLNYHRRNLPIHTDDPFYDRDYNLCIVCARCVRVCDEVRVDTALTLTSRSGTALVGTSHGTSLLEAGCEFCGACIDVCPTGALVERDYKWEKAVKTVKTVCTNCPVGCQMSMEVNKRNKAIRMLPDLAGEANQGQACFKGKFAYDYPNHRARIRYPMVRIDGELQRTTWEIALDAAVERLQACSPEERAVIASPRGTNEDNFVAQKLARVALGTNNVDSGLNSEPELLGALERPLGHPGASHPIWGMERSDCVMIVGGNPTEEQTVLAVPVKKAARAGADVVVIDPRPTELTRYATQWIRPKPGTEVTLLSGIARVILDEALENQDFLARCCSGLDDLKHQLWSYDLAWVSRACGVSDEQIRRAARAYAGGPAAIVYGSDTVPAAERSDLTSAVANLALLTGNIGRERGGIFPLYRGANTLGSNDVGCAPGLLPGYRRVASAEDRATFGKAWSATLPEARGHGIADMLGAMQAGRIKAAVVMADGWNPRAGGMGDGVAALQALGGLIVSAVFHSEITETADVVLPAAPYAEQTGTVTNLERRVQLMRPGWASRNEERPGWQTLAAVAERMGIGGFEYDDAADVFAEITRLAPIYAGLSHERLMDGGIQWPCPDADHPGTPILHWGGASAGSLRLVPVAVRETIARRPEDFPFVLAHGRVLHQPDRDPEVFREEEMNRIRRQEFIELHPEDAGDLTLAEGDLVEVQAASDRTVLSGTVRFGSPHRGLVSVTTLFGEIASAMQSDPDPDPSPRVPGLPLLPVRLVKVAGRRGTAAGSTARAGRSGS